MANYKLNSKHKLTSFQSLTNEGIKQFSKKYTRKGKFVGYIFKIISRVKSMKNKFPNHEQTSKGSFKG